jgi:autophagy-related protein 9
MTWSSVVSRLISVERLCRIKDNLTPLDVCHRIMRRENYLIAMINKRVLALHVPCMPGSRLITKSLEWSISWSLFGFFFDHSRLRYSPEALNR